jgi:hypothetical protein
MDENANINANSGETKIEKARHEAQAFVSRRLN